MTQGGLAACLFPVATISHAARKHDVTISQNPAGRFSFQPETKIFIGDGNHVGLDGNYRNPAQQPLHRRAGLQLIVCIICMVLIANLQYGWTLFVNPINKAHGWSIASIQFAFASSSRSRPG